MGGNIMRNRANNSLARVPQILKNRSIFPINFSRKQTMKASYITPIFYEEVLPGDTWELYMKAFVRLMPQVTAPIDNLQIATFFFFDPHRLQWKNFVKQQGQRDNPEDTIDYTTPTMIPPEGGFAHKSLQDYLGKPVGVAIANTSLGERMYNRIWNEYFRSEFLQDRVYQYDGDNQDTVDNYKLLKISKMHDYFTDALPTLQAGEPVRIPLGTRAPVYGDSALRIQTVSAAQAGINSNLGYLRSGANNSGTGSSDNTLMNLEVEQISSSSIAANTTLTVLGKRSDAYGNPIPSGIYADLSAATAADIAALRLMIRTEEILERDNRNGVRYTEMLEGRYGCVNPDLQLYRPQYLGGTKTPFTTTPVVQTSGTGTGTNTPQGNIAGYGVGGDEGQVVRASFGEFGAIMGLMVITATPQYQYGLDRKFTRMERFDYFYPEFQGLSDQEITNKELFAQNDSVIGADGEYENEKTWGYIGRYDDYRYFKNQICGELRSNYPQSLDVWTYAEAMEELQNLNGNFLEDKTDEILKRSMAIQIETNEDEGEGEEEEEEEEEEEIAEQFLVDIAYSGVVSRGMVSKPVPQTGGRIF